jgi:hypothetical protein
MLSGEEIVARIGARPSGQQDLFGDPAYAIRNTPFELTGDPAFDREWLIYFWLVAYVPDGRGRERTDYDRVWRTYRNGTLKLFNFTNYHGDHVATNQAAIDLKLYRDRRADEQLAELLLWLPRIKAEEQEFDDAVTGAEIKRKIRYIHLFEHTLSYATFFHIYIEGETGDPPGRSHLITKWRTAFSADLPTLVNHCRMHHWYEKHFK